MRKPLAYMMSLLVWGAAVSTPTAVFGQTLPGSPFQGSGGGGVSLSGTNTWTGAQTFTTQPVVVSSRLFAAINLGVYLTAVESAATPAILVRAEQTPDAPVLATSTTSNSWLMAEQNDVSFDFAHPLQTNPTLFVENALTDTTQHNGVAYYGFQGRAITALGEASATSVVQIPVAAGAGVGGTIDFTIFASDATDHQTLTGVLQYAAVNKASTETCATPTLTGTALNSVSLGTLTCTYACSTAPADAVNIQFNCTSSLTQTTLNAYWRLNALGASEPLPQ